MDFPLEFINQFTAQVAGQERFTLTWDIAVIAFLFVAVFLYGLNAGRKRLALFIVSFYGSIALVSLFPMTFLQERTGGVSSEATGLVLLVLFTVLFYFVFTGSLVKAGLPLPKRGKGHIWQIFLLSIAFGGFLASVLGVVAGPLLAMELSTPTRDYFTADIARFLWALAPALAILIAAQRSDKHGR
ncbi:MAG: hypothetical protein WD850_01330 [Candidatus Spechtbacterales bacterium]